MSRYIFPPGPVTSLPVAGIEERFAVRRILCMGRNYADHVREMNKDPGVDLPFFFAKPTDAIVESGARIPFPPLTENLHFEGELVVAIGKGGSNIGVEEANAHIFGYAAGNDLTRRDVQLAARDAGQPWEIGKSFDRSAVCGTVHPVTETGFLDTARLQVTVNGVLRQSASIAEMIYSIPAIIALLSRSAALAPGDLIFTGTPAGVGALVPGDRCSVAIDGLTPAVVEIGT